VSFFECDISRFIYTSAMTLLETLN